MGPEPSNDELLRQITDDPNFHRIGILLAVAVVGVPLLRSVGLRSSWLSPLSGVVFLLLFGRGIFGNTTALMIAATIVGVPVLLWLLFGGTNPIRAGGGQNSGAKAMVILFSAALICGALLVAQRAGFLGPPQP